MIKLEGYVFKLSPSSLKGWQKRYFVMYENKLKYYKDQSDF